jgi:hypothetical protein
MDRYSFTVEVAGISPTEEERYEDRLYAAGCDDALVAVINGTLFLDFDREAPSYDKAVESAVHNVTKAGGKVVHVTRITG